MEKRIWDGLVRVYCPPSSLPHSQDVCKGMLIFCTCLFPHWNYDDRATITLSQSKWCSRLFETHSSGFPRVYLVPKQTIAKYLTLIFGISLAEGVCRGWCWDGERGMDNDGNFTNTMEIHLPCGIHLILHMKFICGFRLSVRSFVCCYCLRDIIFLLRVYFIIVVIVVFAFLYSSLIENIM